MIRPTYNLLPATLVLLLVGWAGAVGAAPASIEFPSAQGLVRFDHADHAGRLECSQCHLHTPPDPFNVDETFAHNTCLGCHRNGGSGPTACSQCHRGATSQTAK